MIEFGSQLYTFRNEVKSKEQVPELFKKLSSYGCTCAQISAMCPIDPGELRKIADANGISLPVTHSAYERIIGDTDKLAEEHRILGADFVGLGIMPAKYNVAGLDGIKRFTEEMNTAGEKLKAYNLRLAYHNHSHEFKKIDGKLIYDYLLEMMPDTDMIFDVFWAKFSGVEPQDFMKKLENRATVIHLKDYKKGLFVGKICDVGDGVIDFKAVLDVAERIGTKYAVIEHDTTRKPYLTTEKGMKYIESIL